MAVECDSEVRPRPKLGGAETEKLAPKRGTTETRETPQWGAYPFWMVLKGNQKENRRPNPSFRQQRKVHTGYDGHAPQTLPLRNVGRKAFIPQDRCHQCHKATRHGKRPAAVLSGHGSLPGTCFSEYQNGAPERGRQDFVGVGRLDLWCPILHPMLWSRPNLLLWKGTPFEYVEMPALEFSIMFHSGMFNTCKDATDTRYPKHGLECPVERVQGESKQRF